MSNVIELENNVKMEVMNLETFQDKDEEKLKEFIGDRKVIDIEDEVIMDDVEIGDSIDIVSKNGDIYYKGTFKRVE